MTLESLSPNTQNTLVDPVTPRPAKRQKTEDTSERSADDSPDHANLEPQESFEPSIDSILPGPSPAKTPDSLTTSRIKDPITGCWTSSIYVDAFDLVLDTVLAEESYLFSPDEQEIFAKYRSLPYPVQFLYVRLFLRKSNAWFRINRFQYQSDIPDLAAACEALQDPAVGLAEKDDCITLEEVAELLSLDELKTLAKDAKCTGMNKTELIAQLRKSSKTQGSLQCNGGQLKLCFDDKGKYMNREKQAVGKILEKTGPCIRLSPGTTALFNRLHLVFYRSTQWTEHSLTTVILARTQRRNFPEYIVSRTSSIFPTREDLLSYEAALQLQDQVDTHLMTPSSEAALAAVKEIFDAVYSIWKSAVSTVPTPPPEEHYLLRFTPLWVQTRIVHKGAYVLGRFKEYQREHEVLTALLSQTPYHPSRRGGWYTRLALLEEKHLPGASAGPVVLRRWREKALGTCERGLQDPMTHLIYHHDLQKRIARLEKALKVPKRGQHDFSHIRLTPPLTTTIFGTRLSDPTVGSQTIWQHPLDGSECSVETLALAHYEQQGYSGLHDEGKILRSIFAACFHDILFLPLPNVFQTAYQTAPLDLFTDSFFPSRASEINHRLALLSSGSAPSLIRSFWEEHAERQTCVVGMDWGVEEEACVAVAEGLGGEAVAGVCRVLAEEWRVRARGMPDLCLWRRGEKGGWEAKMVEVKSENDRLSETQRVWGSVLRGLGVGMEVCWVLRKEERGKVEGKKAKKGGQVRM